MFPELNSAPDFKTISTFVFAKFLNRLFENIQTLFHLQLCLSRKSPTTRKKSKTFSPPNLSQPQIINIPEIFKDFPATNSSNEQQQPAAATSSSNQQQQPTAAINSSNQQQQPAAATNSSNQQQQPAATTSNSNQHSSYQQHLHNPRRLPLVITTVPSSGYVRLEVDVGLAAR